MVFLDGLSVDEDDNQFLVQARSAPAMIFSWARPGGRVQAAGNQDVVARLVSMVTPQRSQREICTKHGIEYRTEQADVANRDEAVLWIIKNQLGRRNLQAIDRVPLVERQRGILEAQAKARQVAHLAKGTEIPVVILVSQRDDGRVRDKLAKQAGVGRTTYVLLKEITEKGTPELVEAVRNKEISAKNAATIASLPKEEQNEQIPLLDRQLVTV